MSDAALAWIVVSLVVGGNCGWFLGYQRAVRMCRRIADSARLDHVFKEDASKDRMMWPEPAKIIHAANEFERQSGK